MIVHITELETPFASSALVSKLVEADFRVHREKPLESSMDMQPNPERVVTVQWSDDAHDKLVDLLLGYIFSDWLLGWIMRRISELHPYLTDDEAEYVALLTFHGLRESGERIGDLTYDEWTQRVREAVQQVLEHETPLDVVGVMRFRARNCLAAIDEGIHEMVEQFLADREYEEFVSMLRYMLDSQKATDQIYHVFCTDERVWICNSEGELVRDKEVTAAAVHSTEDSEVNPEDLAMSILITRSPCQIVIHDLTVAAPWPSFAETLSRVFLERATRCGGCASCTETRIGPVDLKVVDSGNHTPN